MKKSIDELIHEFISDQLFLNNYTKTENLSNLDYDPKLTVKIGKRINKNLEIILQSNEGLENFIELLQSDNEFIRYIVARFLYPVIPSQSIKIMKEFKNSQKDELEVHNIENLINGFETKQKIFMDNFKKLYNCEDLDALNRERD